MNDLGLIEEISANLDTKITNGDSDQDSELFGPLYVEIKKQIKFLNAAVQIARDIDPEVPKARREERKRVIGLEARATFEAQMEKPIAELEAKLAEKIETDKAEVRATGKKPDEVVLTEMRAQESRALLLGMEEPVRVQVLMDAAKDGNLAVIDAAREAPFPIVPSDALARVEDHFYSERHPSLYLRKNLNREIVLQARERCNRVTRGFLRSLSISLGAQLPKKTHKG